VKRLPPLWGSLLICMATSHTPAIGQVAQTDACLGIPDASDRLACFDQQAGEKAMLKLPTASGSFMSSYWELDTKDKRGTFNYTSYRPNYLLPFRGMRKLNRSPRSPTRSAVTDLPAYQRFETKLQLSMRSKVAESILLPGADIWVAYTQQSMWQLWNRSESAPFRNSDFQPEVIYVVPAPSMLQLLPFGWTWKMSQVAWVHQSNGQPGELSRSWNRVYAGVGLERGDVTVTVRLEQRLDVGPDQTDDNPDIVTQMGRLEAQGTWSTGRSTFTLLWRPALHGRGQTWLDWTYPVYNDHPDGLRWYLQAFHGYGETLLDYNFKQTSLGLGLTLFKF